MKIVVCWSDISGYMAACWRALASMPGVELFVVAWTARAADNTIAFQSSVLAGIPHRLLDERERLDAALVRDIVLEQRPDCVYLCGWFIPAYVALTSEPRLSNAKFVMGMDTNWRGEPKQYFARFRLRHYISRLSAIFTGGERAWQYARRLSMPEERIYRGIYGCDYAHFSTAMDLRLAKPAWPKSFVYVGRYVQEKAIDTLLAGYAQYRQTSPEPWGLTCIGRGPMQEQIRSSPGVRDLGFVQPQNQPAALADAGVFVLASRYEPWGVVVAEAAAAGLPLICTEAVSASVELVRNLHNGFRVATDQPAELARAMRWMEEHHERLPSMGRAAQHFARAHGTDVWAENVLLALSRDKR